MRNIAKKKKNEQLARILLWWGNLSTDEKIRKFKAYKEQFRSEAIGHEQLMTEEITSIFAFID